MLQEQSVFLNQNKISRIFLPKVLKGHIAVVSADLKKILMEN